MRHYDWHLALSVLSLCIVWYTMSSTGSIMHKLLLQVFPYPLTVSMSSLLGTSLYSIPFMHHCRISRKALPKSYLMKFVVPLAFGKVLAVCMSYFSLWKVPVSYAQTVKATMPLFAVFWARMILGERQNSLVYCSLIPIVCGVAIASATELSFSFMGFFTALGSTFTYALLNSIVKKVLVETGLHHVDLLRYITQIACLVLLPVWCIYDVTEFLSFDSSAQKENSFSTPYVLGMLFCTGILNFIQNLCTFTLIHKLSALSYAVANATKRITVVTVSLLTLKNPVTPLNVVGMLIAIVGVLGYNRARQTHRGTSPDTAENADSSILASSMSEPTLTELNMLKFAVGNNHLQEEDNRTFWRRISPGNNGTRPFSNNKFEDV